MTSKSKNKGEYGALVALGAASAGSRLALTTTSTAFTSGKLTPGLLYKVSLDPASSGVAWIEPDGTAAIPASDADMTAGFWLMPGESEILDATSLIYSAILTAGTGTLYVTRLST